MQAVLHQVGGHRIAETVEKVGANADQRQDNPRLVAEEVGEGLEREFLGTNGFQTFAREQAAGEGAQGRHSAQHHAQHGILMLRGTAHHPLQVREGKQHHKAHRVGAHHTER